MPSGSAAIIIWVLVFVGIFYFLAIRPQRRQKAAHDEMERMLKKGDEVLTLAGIYGTVTRIGDDYVELEIAKRTKVRFLKRAIASITTIAEDEEEEEEFIEADEDEVIETADEDVYAEEEFAAEDLTDEEIVEIADEDVVIETADDTDETPEAPPAPKA